MVLLLVLFISVSCDSLYMKKTRLHKHRLDGVCVCLCCLDVDPVMSSMLEMVNEHINGAFILVSFVFFDTFLRSIQRKCFFFFVCVNENSSSGLYTPSLLIFIIKTKNSLLIYVKRLLNPL